MKKTLGLRVSINEGKAVIGAADDLSVLSTTVTLVGALGPRSVRKKGRRRPDMELHLGGLTSRPNDEPDEHLTWYLRTLKAGDRIAIEVAENSKPSRVIRRKAAGGKSSPSGERAMFEKAKSIYFVLKEKYERNK